MKKYIGIDIGGTKCSVVLGDSDGNIIKKQKFATCGVNETIAKILDITEEFAKDGAVAVGISCGGPLNPSQGVIQSPPNLPGWDNIPITRLVSERCGLKAYLCNDANACALAEWKYGAGRGCRNMVFLTFGTGMGAGLILDGRLYSGTNDMAGEVGHIRIAPTGPTGYGKAGSFEGFCSGVGIAQLGKAFALATIQMGQYVGYCSNLSELDDITAEGIAEAAKNGDPTAIRVYEICGERLGIGLSIIIDIINPEKIVIGSIFERSGQLLRESMEKVIAEEALTPAREVCEIVPAMLGDSLGDRAALAIAVDGEENHHENSTL